MNILSVNPYNIKLKSVYKRNKGNLLNNINYSNLRPLTSDTISFSAKSPEKELVIDSLNDSVLDSIQDVTKKYDVYIVGGYMRDYFNGGQKSHDWDLVCTHNAKEMAEELAEKKQGNFITLDETKGIYRVVFPDKTTYFDIAQAQNCDIAADSKRRDLTINSIFYNLNTHRVIDNNGGIEDIKNNVLRTPLLENFIEDPLRMLRVYRFMAKTGFEPDEQLSQYCKNYFSDIKKSSPERIQNEITGLFSAKYCEKAIDKMYTDGALSVLFPFIDPQTYNINETIKAMSYIPSDKPLLKFALLCLNADVSSEEISKTMKSYKFSNKQISYVKNIIENYITPEKLREADNQTYANIIKDLKENCDDAVIFAKAVQAGKNIPETDDIISLKKFEDYYKEIKNIMPSFAPLLTGQEVAQFLQIKPSVHIGKILNGLLNAQLTGKVHNKKEAFDYILSEKIS